MDLLIALHNVAQAADRLMTEALGDSELTPRQAMILNVIDGAGAILQSELITATNADRSTMSDVLRRLVAHGLISRTGSIADARLLVVSLTPKGRTALKKCRTAAVKAEAALRADYPQVVAALAILHPRTPQK
jgi:MarR family transcriptional regulator, lower aerobic nicotinate degradation pathway regulator